MSTWWTVLLKELVDAFRDRRMAITALVVNSRLRIAISGRLYLPEMTSPCSVVLIRPETVPGGWARIASCVGPPPRPTVPPRP